MSKIYKVPFAPGHEAAQSMCHCPKPEGLWGLPITRGLPVVGGGCHCRGGYATPNPCSGPFLWAPPGSPGHMTHQGLHQSDGGNADLQINDFLPVRVT